MKSQYSNIFFKDNKQDDRDKYILGVNNMKIFLKLLLVTICLTGVVYASDIRYGYNARGEYVPTSVGNDRIHYGYNARGEYVPTSVGNQRIQYGYNARGEYVPTSYGNQRVQYGYNARGQYVPKTIGQ